MAHGTGMALTDVGQEEKAGKPWQTWRSSFCLASPVFQPRAVFRGIAMAAATTTAMTRTPLLGHRVRHRVVRLLEGLQVELGFVLARDVPSHGVVPRERPLAERAWHPDPLVALPYVGAQVRLVAVQLLAVRALQFLA